MWNRLTPSAKQAIFNAQEVAENCYAQEVETEHLLLGLLKQENTPTTKLLNQLEINTDSLIKHTELHLIKHDQKSISDLTLSDSSKQAMHLAFDEARAHNSQTITPEHILSGLTREPNTIAHEILKEFNISIATLRSMIQKMQTSD